MDNSFFEALSSLGSEANVDTALLVEKVKSAMLKAARKAYPECEENISVEIDPATKTFEMYLRQTVVDDEPIDANEVNIDVARTIDPNACVGGFIERRLDIAKFGRAAAQSAKQSIKGDLRAAAGALALSLGIAIQNFPEGAIISMPLRAEGMKKGRAFWGGVLSGIVEPIGAVLTILAAGIVVPALPYLLSFAAGAMLYVVVEELIPEMSQGQHSNVGTVFFAVGFSVMMVLDVALG